MFVFYSSKPVAHSLVLVICSLISVALHSNFCCFFSSFLVYQSSSFVAYHSSFFVVYYAMLLSTTFLVSFVIFQKEILFLWECMGFKK